jgi:hypothetical protein
MSISKINNIIYTDLGKFKGVTKANLGKFKNVSKPVATAAAPVTSGLVGYFRASDSGSITTDTSGGTTTVSQWNNIASDAGGEASQTWNLTQGTKANQPTYDSSASTIYFDGTDILTGLSGKMPYDADWSAVWIADADTRGFSVFAGGASVNTYMRFHSMFAIVGPKMGGNAIQWSLSYSGASGDTDIYAGDYNVLGCTWDASESSSYAAAGAIVNQYYLTTTDDCDHANCVGASGYNNYTAPSSTHPFINLGAYNGQTNSAQFLCREFMVFNRVLNQTDTTAIYNYADGIVTLNEFTNSGW